MRRAVRRFMPGETLDSTRWTPPRRSRRPASRTMYTRLGENLESLAEADAVADHYIDGPGRDRGARASRRGVGQADPAGPRSRRGPAPRPPRRASPSMRPPTGSYLVDRHGGQRLRRRRPSALYERLRAVAAADGDLPAGVPAADRRRHRTACARSTRPSAWSRAPTTSQRTIAYATSARSTPATSAWRSASSRMAAAGRSGSASGTHDVALIEQIAEQVGAGRDRSRRLRDRDAVRHPDGRAVPPGEARAIASRPSSPTASTGIPWYMRRLAERPANVIVRDPLAAAVKEVSR